MKRKALILLIWIAIWQVAAVAVGSKLLLPSPVDTVTALLGMLGDSGFYLDALATIGRCLVAMLLALALGFLLSVESYRHRAVRDILSLPVSLFKSIPIMAVAIYMILLLSPSNVPVLVCWIMCFPIVYTNLLTGLDSMDNSLLEMAKVYSISGRRKLRLIYMPSLYPYFSSAMSLMAGMSWKAIVTAEVLSIPKFSLGYELMNAKYYLNTDKLFAYVLTIIAISVAFERLIKLVLTRFKPHEYQYSKVWKLGEDTAESGKIGHAEVVMHDAVKLTAVNKSYGEKSVLENFDLTLEPGRVTALMGPSGRGKTTVARILSGLETADAGEVRAPERIAYLFQEDRLIPWLNVYDNLAIVLGNATVQGGDTTSVGTNETNDTNETNLSNEINVTKVTNANDVIHRMLRTVELDEEAWKLPGELSGGMSYRVAMARAFIYDADFLIADEPFRGLDAETKKKAIDKLWKPGVADKTVLLITHSAEDAALADTIVNL